MRRCEKQIKAPSPQNWRERAMSKPEKKVLGELVPPRLVESKKSRNADNRNTQLRWSPPGIACKSVTPVPTMMRTHCAWRTRRRGKALRDLGKRDDLDVLTAPMGHPGAAKCSACDIHPLYRSEQNGLVLNQGRWRQKTTDGTDATSTVPFRS